VNISAKFGQIATGPTTASNVDFYKGFTGPTNFGTGGFVAGNTLSGDSVGILGAP
jgi:hypothetical protein